MGHTSQNLISRIMPEGIIDPFEVIDVRDGNNDGAFFVVFSTPLLTEHFVRAAHARFKPAAIEKPGKRVDFGLCLKRFYLPCDILLSSCISFALILQSRPCRGVIFKRVFFWFWELL